jgi:glutaminyl-tRNA synthetase
MNPSSLQIVKDCRTKFSNGNLERNSSFNVCYFNVDKDTVEGKIVFNKTVGLKDAWEEKGKKKKMY